MTCILSLKGHLASMDTNKTQIYMHERQIENC